jgi:conjugative transfer signal peptidase TraF
MRGTYLCILSGVIALYILRGSVAINISDSLPRGIFFLTAPTDLDREDLILFQHSTADSLAAIRGYVRGGAPLGKRIAALPGDQVSVGERVIVNGRNAAAPAPGLDSRGRAMERFTYHGTVPQGAVFVLGDTPDSFDSRYYGFVQKADITNTLQPLLIWTKKKPLNR